MTKKNDDAFRCTHCNTVVDVIVVMRYPTGIARYCMNCFTNGMKRGMKIEQS